MKVNYIGIVAGILAFIALALPWYTVSTVIALNFNLFDFANLTPDFAAYAYATLAFLVIGGVLGLAGGAMAGGTGKKLLLGAGVLDILAIIVFIVGGYSIGIQFFVSTPAGSAFVSYGFWITLVAAILAFVAFVKHPAAETAAPPAPA